MTPAQRRRKARMRQAVELHDKGWSLRAIAAHLGVNHETVRRDLSHLGVENATPPVAKGTTRLPLAVPAANLYGWDCESTLWCRWAFADVEDLGVVTWEPTGDEPD